MPASLAHAVETALRAVFPAWAAYVHTSPDPPASDFMVLNVPSLRNPGSQLRVHVSPGEAVVMFSDGQPPGPAERLLVCPPGEEAAFSMALALYLQDIVDGRVVLVRQPLSRLMQAVRRHDAESLPRLLSADEAQALRASRSLSVLAWVP